MRAEVVKLTSRTQKYEAQTVLTVLKLWHHETVHSFEEVKAEQKRIAAERGLPDPEPLLAEEDEESIIRKYTKKKRHRNYLEVLWPVYWRYLETLRMTLSLCAVKCLAFDGVWIRSPIGVWGAM